MSNIIQRGIKYAQRRGLMSAIRETREKTYESIKFKAAQPILCASEEQLAEWSKETFDYNPTFSILIPMYNTPLGYFQELLGCIQGQIYGNWELCLADGSGQDTEAAAWVCELAKSDSRIKYQRLEQNGGISENTNAALAMATGDYIVLCDHDDLLPKDALYHVVKALNDDPSIDMLYTDEDKVDMESRRHFDPHLKPDFNIDLFRSVNYICHLFVVRTSIADPIGFSKEYDGAQDFDFILRCSEEAKRIHHIPRILYHWRSHPASTASASESKPYTSIAGAKAVQDHLDRVGIKATASMHPKYPNRYDVTYQPLGEPRVTLVSTTDLAAEVVDTLTTAYGNLQPLLLEGAYEPATLNAGIAEEAEGEYLLFVDPRTTQVSPETLALLLNPFQRQELVSTFGKVQTLNGKVYSAGFITGIAGCVDRFYHLRDGQAPSYQVRLEQAQNLLASDLSLAMLRRSAFDAVGGLDESFCIDAAAADLFLKMGEQGGLHLFQPSAQARLNFKVGRFANRLSPWLRDASPLADRARFIAKWPQYTSEIGGVDPYYNPNFDQRSAWCKLPTRSCLKVQAEKSGLT